MFCKFLKEKYQKLAKYYNEIRTSPNAYYLFDFLLTDGALDVAKKRCVCGFSILYL